MSKFLKGSKTFLPLVLRKSTSETFKTLNKCSSFSTAPREELTKKEMPNEDTSKLKPSKEDPLKQELPKQDLSKLELLKQEVPKQEQPKQELPKPDLLKQEITKQEISKLNLSKEEILHQEKLKQNKMTSKEDLKIVLHKRPEIPLMESCKIPETVKANPDQQIESLKVVSVSSKNQKSLLQAFLLDLTQLQRGLVLLLLESRIRLWTALGVQAGSGTSSELRIEDPKSKERAPMLLSVRHKKSDRSKEGEKCDETETKPPFLSNLWEAVKENSPQWQKSISKNLGKLQKVVVDKLSK